MQKVISRAEAKALGLKWYFTGKPCPHGHVCERLCSISTCKQCSYADNLMRRRAAGVLPRSKMDSTTRKRKNAERTKEWRKANGDHIREYKRRKYRERSQAQRVRDAAAQKLWRQKKGREYEIEMRKRRCEREKAKPELRAHKLINQREYYRKDIEKSRAYGRAKYHQYKLVPGFKESARERAKKDRQAIRADPVKWLQFCSKKRAYDKEHREKHRADYLRYYYEGPINPNSEASWLRKNKALLRTAKRLLRNLGRSQLQSGESRPIPNLPN